MRGMGMSGSVRATSSSTSGCTAVGSPRTRKAWRRRRCTSRHSISTPATTRAALRSRRSALVIGLRPPCQDVPAGCGLLALPLLLHLHALGVDELVDVLHHQAL